MKKPIVVISPAHPLRGGIAHFTGNLVTHLRRKMPVEVVTFSRQYPSLLFPGKRQEDESEQVLDVGAKVMLDSVNPLSWRRTARYIESLEPHLALFVWWNPFFSLCYTPIARRLSRGLGLPIIALAHNVVPHEPSPVDKFLARRFFGWCEHCVLLSQQTEKELQSIQPDLPSSVLYLPLYDFFNVDSSLSKLKARETLNIPSNKEVVLFFGLVRDYKGLPVLINALSQVKRKNMILIVAGEFYSKKDLIMELIKNLNILEKIHIHDYYIPNEKVPIFFKASDVIALPYLFTSQSAVIQTAFSFGVPVITTDVGGLSEVITHGKTGLLVPPNDAQSLSEALDRYFEEKLHDKFALEVQKEAQKYKWENFIERFIHIIKEYQ